MIHKLVQTEDHVLVLGSTLPPSLPKHDRTNTYGGSSKNPAPVAEEAAAALDCGASCVATCRGGVNDATAIGSLGSFDVVCIEVASMCGNDVVCDGLALVRFVRCILEQHAASGASGTPSQQKDHKLKTTIVKSRKLSGHARSHWNAHRLMSAMGPDAPRLAAPKVLTHGQAIVVCAVGVRDYRSTVPFVVREGYVM